MKDLRKFVYLFQQRAVAKTDPFRKGSTSLEKKITYGKKDTLGRMLLAKLKEQAFQKT